MKIECTDGYQRDFIPLTETLYKLGLSPELLHNDQGLIVMGLRPDIGLIKAIRIGRAGLLGGVKDYITHYSKKSRKKNPIHFHVSKLTKNVRYFAFLPAIESHKELEISGNMSWLTILARFISKLSPAFFGVNNKTATIHTQLLGIYSREFKYNFGYKVVTDEYTSPDGVRYLVLENEKEVQFAIDISMLGFTNVVMICYEKDAG